ncbi:MAG: YCF48-related protein [Bacteroidetes bacterium]|nr:YCF48-related protein [Bacteroidota bacterium]
MLTRFLRPLLTAYFQYDTYNQTAMLSIKMNNIFKSFICFLLINTLLILNCYAQWNWQNPKPQRNSLCGIFFIDEMSGWAVGIKGTIINTEDGGLTWNVRDSGSDIDFNSVFFIDSVHGWIVGDSGLILHTDNGGLEWEEQNSGYSHNLYALFFTDSSIGWIVGHNNLIIHTIDGGINWETQYVYDHNDRFLHSVYFVTPMIGYVVGGLISEIQGGWIWDTNNGGETWNHSYGTLEEPLYSVYFTDQNNGWAVGSKLLILHTDDGGYSWDQQHIITNPLLLTSVCFNDSNNGIAVGDNGMIFFTNDGGQNWGEQSEEFEINLHSIHYVNSQKAIAVGRDGQMTKTDDGGNSWKSISYATTNFLSSVCFIDPLNGWTVGGLDMILHSTDGGNTWINQINQNNNDYIPLRSIYLHSVYFIDEYNGWAVGYSGTIIHTNDGGLNWETQSCPIGTLELEDVLFIDKNKGWILSDHWLLYTNDGGNLWQTTYYENNGFSSIYFLDSQNGWITGYFFLLHTNDGGFSWAEQNIPEGFAAGIVFFTDSLRGWIGGHLDGYSDLIHTTDGGETWEFVDTCFEYIYIKSIFFSDPSNGWVIGRYGNIFRTFDGGNSWEIQFDEENLWFKSASFTDEENGWVVGDHGVILHTNNGGLVWSQQKEPVEQFEVSNFPNPSTGVSSIELTLPHSSLVLIELFDNYGRKVYDVINEKRETGVQYIKLDCNGLAKGVYFYRVVIEKQSVTKKIILI